MRVLKIWQVLKFLEPFVFLTQLWFYLLKKLGDKEHLKKSKKIEKKSNFTASINQNYDYTKNSNK